MYFHDYFLINSYLQSEASCVFFDDAYLSVIDALVPLCPRVRLWVSMQDARRAFCTTFAALAASGSADFPAKPNAATMLYTGGTSGKPKAALRSKPNTAAAMWLKEVDMHLYGHVSDKVCFLALANCFLIEAFVRDAALPLGAKRNVLYGRSIFRAKVTDNYVMLM